MVNRTKYVVVLRMLTLFDKCYTVTTPNVYETSRNPIKHLTKKPSRIPLNFAIFSCSVFVDR